MRSRGELEGEAAARVSDEIEESKEKTRLLHNGAILVSIITVLLLTVLYAYKQGYLKVYRIPAECIVLDLKSYIPFLIQICSVMLYFLWYVISFKTEKVLKKNRFNFMRLLYGTVILLILEQANNINAVIGFRGVLVISITVPVAMEILIFTARIPKKNKLLDEVTYQMRLEDRIGDMLFYRYFIKGGLLLIVIAIMSAQIWGGLMARSKDEYQLCVRNEEHYAVVYDYGDSVLAQLACEDQDKLTIDTSSYTYINKADTTFFHKKYEQVLIE